MEVEKRLRKKKVKIIRLVILFIICIFMFNYDFIINKTMSTKGQEKSITNSNMELAKSSLQFVVCIDPGHGGYDVGTKRLIGVFEKDITLKISLKVGELLERNNIEVVYTRTSDDVIWSSNEKEDLRKRVDISNKANANLFISIHCNGNSNSSFNGIETWCRFTNTEGEKLARNIQNELVYNNYSQDRGLKYESDESLAVLKLNNAVSALVEVGFLTNSADAEFITSESGQEKCAQAIAKGILNYKLTAEK